MMKTYLIYILLMLGWIGSVHAQDANIPEVPRNQRLVNDFTSTLQKGEIDRLERKLVAYNDSTSNQVTVVIVNSVQPYDIAQYAAELGEKWGIGKKGKDNGVLLTIAIEDRRVNISTGYGLEGAITDAVSKRIIEQVIVPNFRSQNYYGGIDQATDVIMQLAAGEFTADEYLQPQGNPLVGLVVIFFIVFMFILPFIRNRNDNNNHMGGKRRNVDMVTTMMLMGMMGGGGSRGGGGFGGSSGGGGFGGFGGGSFGGGGASGSW